MLELVKLGEIKVVGFRFDWSLGGRDLRMGVIVDGADISSPPFLEAIGEGLTMKLFLTS